MPCLSKVVITQLRNIQQAEIHLSPGFNLLHGDNGSGKTSVLEAVHMLGMGRSFRGHQQKPLIKDGCTEAVVFAETTAGLSLGIQRPLRGLQLVQIGGRKAESLADLSRQLPVQLVNTDTLNIVEGSPQERRKFLDWGVFHVEHGFMACWRRARIALQQRNSLLKSGAKASEIEPWTQELAKSAAEIDRQRMAYVLRLKAKVEPSFNFLLPIGIEQALGLSYQRGWPEDVSLQERLEHDLERDRRYGFTGAGPHRADVNFTVGRFAAADLLSRGQLKLLVCALKAAQAQILYEQRAERCVFLLDDLPAELDRQNRGKVLHMLADLQAQVLLTSIEPEGLEEELRALRESRPVRRFHVKHGNIAPAL